MRTFILFLLFSLTLTGCNTFEGMGKDIKQGGQDIQQAANDAK